MAMPTEKPSFGTLDGVKVVYAAVELACPKACDLMADWGRRYHPRHRLHQAG